MSPANYLSHYQQAPYDTVAILLAFENENDKVLTFPSGLCLRDLKEVVSLLHSKPAPHCRRENTPSASRSAVAIANSPSMNSTGTKLTCD